MDTVIAVIWVAFMIIAAIRTVMKKAKQQKEEQARAPTGEEAAVKRPQVYAAPEEDVGDFLEQIGAKPPPIAQPQPVQARPVQPSSPQRKQQHERTSWDVQRDTLMKKAAARRKAHSSFSDVDAKDSKQADGWLTEAEIAADASKVSEISPVNDPVAVLMARLSPIQRAVVWREVLDPPPGLRAGAFTREA